MHCRVASIYAKPACNKSDAFAHYDYWPIKEPQDSTFCLRLRLFLSEQLSADKGVCYNYWQLERCLFFATHWLHLRQNGVSCLFIL